MFLDISGPEINLLNQYALLQPGGKQDVQDYVLYTLFKQYRQELYTAVVDNQPLYNGFLQILTMCEREDTSIEEINAKVKQVKYTFYQRYEKVYLKYSSILTDIPTEDTLRDLGRLGFEHILEAVRSNRKELIKTEIEEFMDSFRKLASPRQKRRIVAV